MRWLFLLVLSLNIAYIAWQINTPEVVEYPDRPKTTNANSIVLLSELKEETGSQTSSVEQSNSDQPDAMQQSIEEKTSNAADDQKVEVVEFDEAEAIEMPEDMMPEDKMSEERAAQVDRCFTIGPFRELEKLRGFVREIRPYVVEANFRDLEERQPSTYWVYIKPEKNRKNAREVGKRLKTKNIKDFYIIRAGEKNNGISLGHFKNKNRAYGLAKKVEKLGFDVLVEPLFKTYTLYWLDYRLGDGMSVPEMIDDKYIQTMSKDKISRLSRDCGS